MGKKAGIAIFRGFQGRRQRKGRRQLFPTMQLNGRMSGGASTSRAAAVPVRTTVQRTATVKDELIRDMEPSSIVVTGNEGDNTEAFAVKVSPMESELFPRLSQKATLFTEYDLIGLVFTWTPNVGSAYNGQIALGWTPNASVEGTDLNNSQDVLSMPVNTQFTASSPASMSVPANQMAQNGRGLFMPNDSAQVGELTRYYAGSVAVLPFQCADTALLGRLSVAYVVNLRRPRLDSTASASRWTLADGVENAGSARYIETSKEGFSYASVRPQVAMIEYVPSESSHALDIVDDIEVITPALTFTVGDGREIKLFELGRRPGRRNVAFLPGTGVVVVAATIMSSAAAWY